MTPTASSATTVPPQVRGLPTSWVRSTSALLKFRLNSMVVFATGAGFLIVRPTPGSAGPFLALLAGTFLAACGTSAMNQALEGNRDGLMVRTRHRPVASGQMAARDAFAVGALLSILGVGMVAVSTTWLAALLTGLTVGLYVFVYTPLKARTTMNTLVGAIPGALPPVIGWAAATGTLGPGAWVLFAIVFLWQFPHFFAIASIHREDYRRGGFAMLPVLDETGLLTSHRVVSTALLLVPVGLMPATMGIDGPLYLVGAALLGLMYLYYSVRAAMLRTDAAWRTLLRASFIHLPGLFLLMLVDRLPF